MLRSVVVNQEIWILDTIRLLHFSVVSRGCDGTVVPLSGSKSETLYFKDLTFYFLNVDLGFPKVEFVPMFKSIFGGLDFFA